MIASVAACGFQPVPSANGDAHADAPGDGSMHAIDAANDAPPDARVCPAAPAGCVAFTCAGSGSCYYSCATARSWTSAETACMSQQVGCLATIDNQAEQDCVTAATLPGFPDLVWFGWVQTPNSPEPAGGWHWACGTSSYVIGTWGMFEPNNSGGNEDCGGLVSGGGWIDGDCSLAKRYVCELP